MTSARGLAVAAASVRTAWRVNSGARSAGAIEDRYMRRSTNAYPDQGCSYWTYRPYSAQSGQKGTTTGISHTAKAGPLGSEIDSNPVQAHDVGFMEDAGDSERGIEGESDGFFIDQVDPDILEDLTSESSTSPPPKNRPKLPKSMKTLNRALGRKQVLDISEDDLVEQFVRGRGPGGQAINKINSSVSLIHKPTGIRIQSQPTRSREQNRTAARHILSERLDQLRTQGLYDPEVKAPVKPLTGRKAEERALAEAYTKGELRAAKERARKLNRAKKHRQKKRRQEEEKEGSEDVES